jgi:CubicO group peptidase (beta-lactamase class C family)
MNYRNLIFLLTINVGLFTNTSIHAESRISNDAFYQDIKIAANTEIKNSKTPSLQISIGVGAEIVYEAAFGFSDLENNVKATPTTKYRAASIAKWFTASAAMRLVENRKLDLEKPIHYYCPEFPNKEWPITTKQLLSHTAGIRGYINYDEVIALAKDDKTRFTLLKKQLLETKSFYARHTDIITPLDTFKDDPLIFRPGSKWEYTSFGYRLVACVMQGAAGISYRKLMKELIFNPANMENTLPDDDGVIIPNRASGYRLQRGEPLRRADMRDISENLAAGGYLSTSTDLVKFALVFNNGIISKPAKKLMSSPVLVRDIDINSPPSWRDAIPSEERYGYGLMLLSKYKKGMVGHTGRQAGGSAILLLLPNENIAIAIMTNAKGWNGYLSFAMKINAIVEKYFP